MFSLIITIISVALVTALALATLYFGGETYRDAQMRTNAAAAISQGQQLLAASELFYLHKRTWPSGVAELQSEGYLNSTPSMPGAMAASGLITPALANAQPWTEVAANAPHFWVRQKVGAELCREINWQARGDNGIYTRALPLLETQCYGTAEPYTVLVHKPNRAAAEPGSPGATPGLEDTVGTVAPGETTGNVTPGDLAGKTAPADLGGEWAEAPTHMLCKLPALDGSFKVYGTLLRNVIPILNGFEFVPCGLEEHTGDSGVTPEFADGSTGAPGGGETEPPLDDEPVVSEDLQFNVAFCSWSTVIEQGWGDIVTHLECPGHLEIRRADGQPFAATTSPYTNPGVDGVTRDFAVWFPEPAGATGFGVPFMYGLLSADGLVYSFEHELAERRGLFVEYYDGVMPAVVTLVGPNGETGDIPVQQTFTNIVMDVVEGYRWIDRELTVENGGTFTFNITGDGLSGNTRLEYACAPHDMYGLFNHTGGVEPAWRPVPGASYAWYGGSNVPAVPGPTSGMELLQVSGAQLSGATPGLTSFYGGGPCEKVYFRLREGNKIGLIYEWLYMINP